MSKEPQILTIPITKVKPWDKNPRSIHKKDFDRLKKHITKYGQYKPLICYKQNGKYVALGGNMRLRAMRELKIREAKILVVQAKSEKARIELSLIDNDRAGYYDDQALAELIYPFKDDFDLANFKVDLRIPDMDLGKVIDRFAPDNEQDDIVPAVRKKTKIKLGHLFKLGKHRLLCGDATKKKDVERLMDGKKADMVFTDPPYGIDIVKVSKKNKTATIGGSKSYGQTSNKGRVGFDRIAKANYYSPIVGDDKPFNPTLLLTLSKQQIIFGANYFASQLPDGKAWLVWDKDVSGTFSEVELIWTSFEGKLRLYHYMWSGLRREGNRKDELTNRIHPTQKPVGLLTQIMGDYTNRGDILLDLYLGSGSTLIACEKLNRICYGTEIDPHYCQVIIDRWEKYTGQKAVKVG